MNKPKLSCVSVRRGAGFYFVAVLLGLVLPYFPSSLEGALDERDWPTYRHDNHRSGRSLSLLPAKLQLKWSYQVAHPPKEAWPGRAQSDWWRKRGTPERKRVTYDQAFEVVSGHGRVYFGSSADDQMRCLDLHSGTLLWRFFADAPIRLAPSLTEERLLFGADDGQVYCLNAISGKQLWKSGIEESGQRWLPGNGRLMSRFPVRTGVMVVGDTAYFGSGLFPKNMGMWYCSLDQKTGKILDQRQLKNSLQGYLEFRQGKMFAPTGRDPRGETLESKVDGGQAAVKGLPKGVSTPGPVVTTVSTSRHWVAGGDGWVALVDKETQQVVWKYTIDGVARSLAVARGCLLVSTDTGHVYSFAESGEATRHVEKSDRSPLPSTRYDVAKMLGSLPTDQGYAVVLDAGADDGELLEAIARQSRMQVHGLMADRAKMDGLRRRLADKGLYGSRITLRMSDPEALYTSRIFNLLVSADGELSSYDRSLLCPQSGVAWNAKLKKMIARAPALPGVGEWTHMYADAGNTACSEDTRVASTLGMQWFGRPGPQHIVDRHLRAAPPLVKNGLLLIPGNNYLFCLDAWNGTILWEKALPDFRRIGVLRDSGNMVLADDLVYCATASRCQALDVYSGELRLSLELPAPYRESGYHWGCSALSDGVLLGSAVKQGGVYRKMNYQAIYESNYGDKVKVATSDVVFAMDRKSGQLRWQYQPGGSVINPSISVADGRVYLIESGDPLSLKRKQSRMSYPELVGQAGVRLVCLDLQTGAKIWTQEHRPADGMHTPFTLAKDGRLVLVYSCNRLAEGAKKPTMHYEVYVFSGENGALVWKDRKNYHQRPNLDHGEQDRHPAMVGEQLVMEPYIYDLATGKVSGQFKRVGGGGCGTISASGNALYFRAKNLASYDLNKSKGDRITSVSRSGCWINMIPAGGLLLVPEGSSGCICNFAVQGSMAFAPLDE